MKKTRNIFLTALGETKKRLDVKYYECETADGNPVFTTGISVPEAGIKYILSRQVIDEIIVIGPAKDGNRSITKRTNIDEVQSSTAMELDDMSEFDFLTYRIAEFIKQIDFEILDISEKVSAHRKNKIKKMLSEFRTGFAGNIDSNKLFVKLCSNDKLALQFRREILSNCDPDERKWVREMLYNSIDSFYKMHMLSENSNTNIRFVPIETDGTITIESINTIVGQILEGDRGEINLFMDIQGIDAIDGNTIISTFMLMDKCGGYSCNLKGLIHSFKASATFAGKVSNVIKSYDIQNLISGTELFLKYGKVEMLRNYWLSLESKNPVADRLFYGMDCIDEGITLCNVDLIASGMNIIRKVIRDYENEGSGRDIYLEIIISAITADYGPLLKGDELSIPELLKWSLRKGLYQQTLTIIESKIPEDMVKRGIYYYARNEEDIKKILKDWNILYWNDSLKCRWAFNEVEHFFIKNYGRTAVDYRQKPDMIAKDYAKLRVTVIHKEVEGVLPAYSELENDDLLFELLLGYYRIGNLRNQVNHAIVEETDLNSDNPAYRKDNRRILNVELGKFINLYNAACRKTVKKHEPVLLAPEKLKNYVRRHELKVVEAAPDLAVNNIYSCSYNGKEVQISIAMLAPEEDIEES